MMGRTHMAIGLLAGLVLFTFFNQPWYIFIPLVIFGSLLPDVDHENSKINRMIPLTRWIPTFFVHRGFFHSIFPAIIIYVGLHLAKLDILGIPLAIGYTSHLASDCLTRLGCNLLHPISTFRIQGPIMTNGLMELLTLGGVIILDVLIMVKHIL
jgi:inner membrane protein